MPAFREHIDDLLSLSSQGAGGEAETMIKAALNRAYQSLQSKTGQPSKTREFDFTTVASTGDYGMPLYVNEILSMTDQSNDEPIEEITKADFDELYPDNADTGTPEVYCRLGEYGVQKQPASSGVLTVVSDSTADATNFFLTATGYDSNGVFVRDKMTMNGTTTVTGTVTFDPADGGIERLVKTANSGYSWTGNITVSDDDGNVIARIPNLWDSPSYLWIRFYPIPSSAVTYTVSCNAYKPPLVNDEDWPDFDERFHDLLTYMAGVEILPAFGKPELATSFAAILVNRMREYKGLADVAANVNIQMSNITAHVSGPRLGQPIKGIDVGRAEV